MVVVYEIMHMERVVAQFSSNGKSRICDAKFMPYDLYLEEEDEDDIDILVNNVINFNHWCASQATTDLERAKISLSYHCVSLTDVYWIRQCGEEISFAELNLYDHPLNDAIVELSLKGHQMTVANHELAPDLSTKGCRIGK